MYELWMHDSTEWRLVGQYPTRKQAVAIARDYGRQGFRAEVRVEGRAVWVGGYPPTSALK